MNMIKNLTIALLGLALPLMGQSAPVKTTPTDTPQLSKTELLAVNELKLEFDQVQKVSSQASKDLQDFQAEIAVAHPGYFFDPQKGLVKKEDKPVVKAPDASKVTPASTEKR